jgi:hypothetical protein
MPEPQAPRQQEPLTPLEKIDAIGKLAGYLARAHRTNERAAGRILGGEKLLTESLDNLSRLLVAAHKEIEPDSPEQYCTCCWPEAHCGRVPRTECGGSRGECID